MDSIKVRRPSKLLMLALKLFPKSDYLLGRLGRVASALPKLGDTIEITWFPDNNGYKNAYIGTTGEVTDRGFSMGYFYTYVNTGSSVLCSCREYDYVVLKKNEGNTDTQDAKLIEEVKYSLERTDIANIAFPSVNGSVVGVCVLAVLSVICFFAVELTRKDNRSPAKVAADMLESKPNEWTLIKERKDFDSGTSAAVRSFISYFDNDTLVNSSRCVKAYTNGYKWTIIVGGDTTLDYDDDFNRAYEAYKSEYDPDVVASRKKADAESAAKKEKEARMVRAMKGGCE